MFGGSLTSLHMYKNIMIHFLELLECCKLFLYKIFDNNSAVKSYSSAHLYEAMNISFCFSLVVLVHRGIPAPDPTQ